MLGLAQKLFLEKASNTVAPWKGVRKSAPLWPLVEKLLQHKYLDYVDFALAQRLLKPFPQASEAVAALLCHLSLAARQGHLCVSIIAESVYPSVDSVWLPPNDISEATQPLSTHTRQELTRLIAAGSVGLPNVLCAEISQEEGDDLLSNFKAPSTPICKHGQRYYLQRYWMLESLCLKQIWRMISQPEPTEFMVDVDTVRRKVAELIEHRQLLSEQGAAVMHGCLHPLTIIIGGPGTGKTHTAGVLLRTYWESLSIAERGSCRIALAAPTGKAAANLEVSIRKAVCGMEGFRMPVAQTLHALLGIGKSLRQGPAPVLPYDVILVDECSMIDVRVMCALLTAIKFGAKVIMLGDPHQLPPVEAGSLFADLVAVLQASVIKMQCVTELKVCLRAELQVIVDLAAHINSGNAEGVKALFNNCVKDSGIAYVPFDPAEAPKDQQRRLLTYAQDKFPCIDTLANPIAALQEFSRFRILTPLRKGPLGVETLNMLFLSQAIKQAQKKHVPFLVAPIMIVQNDHRQELFNGEIGLLVRPLSPANRKSENSSEDMAGSYALFTGKLSEGTATAMRRIPAVMLPKYEYAYCLSVHKSQGSEFEQVVMLLPEGSEHFGREVLYTGVTRARKSLEIWASMEIFVNTMAQVSHRHSGIAERLKGF